MLGERLNFLLPQKEYFKNLCLINSVLSQNVEKNIMKRSTVNTQ